MISNLTNSIRFKSDLSCVLCKSADGQVKLFKERYVNIGQYIYFCGHCSHVYCNPLLDDISNQYFYEKLYRIYYPDQIPSNSKEFFDFKNKNQSNARRADLINNKHNNISNLLDVGSGFGGFLFEWHKIKSNTTLLAIEPDKNNRTLFINGLNVNFHEDFESVSSNSLDLIVAFHVLEHTNDPVSFLKNCSDKIKSSGSIYIEVPDLSSDWTSLNYFHTAHVSYFHQNTLLFAAKKANLVPVYCGIHPIESLSDNLWMECKKETLNKVEHLDAGKYFNKKILSRLKKVKFTISIYISYLIRKYVFRFLNPVSIRRIKNVINKK